MKTFARTVMIPESRKPGSPEVPCHVEIEIDFDRLFAYLGVRALRNKSKKTVEMSGLVKARTNIIKKD